MYTVRKQINQNNVSEIIARIARIGYKELEIFGYSGREKFWGLQPKAFKTLLKQHQLKSPAAHIQFENFLTGKDENELRLICEAAVTVGNRYLILAWLPEQYRQSADDYKLLAEKLNKAAIIAGQYSLQLAYHNHDFEFKTLEDESTGYDILLRNTGSQLVKMELDLYWTVRAGRDPVRLFNDNPGRFPLWHVKDLDPVGGSFTEVGSGSINFPQIFEHKKTAGLQHFFIEQDEVKKDVFESIRESFGYAKKYLV